MRLSPTLIFALAITASADAQQVSLSVSEKGYMALNWSVTNPGAHDFVALYDGDPYVKGPNDYLTYQWQSASGTSPHVTNTPKGWNNYIAYIAQACLTCTRTIKAVAGPFASKPATVSLTVSENGYMTLHWEISDPGAKDFVALFEGDHPVYTLTHGYLTNQYQWATRSSPYVTGKSEGFSYWTAYVEEDGNGNRRIRAAAGPDACLANRSTTGDAYVSTLSRCLAERYGEKHSGKAFALTTNNALSGRWVEQTPSVWGMEAFAVPAAAGSYVADDIQALISQAEQFVDITTLAPYPDAQFQAAILNGLTAVARSGRAVTVRILAGWPELTVFRSDGVRQFLNSFADPLSQIANNKVKLYVAAQRSSAFSWNHSKMVAVDSKAILLGGENQWANDYLGTTPVHDLNVILRGPAAYAGHQFADLLWQGVCLYRDDWMPWSWEPGQRINGRSCLSTANVREVAGQGSTSVLGAGRYGTMEDHSGATIQPSDFAMALSLNAAAGSIRIAQQDLTFQVGPSPALYWDDGMNAIAKAIANRHDVYIVLSNDGSKGGKNPYSMGTLKRQADKLKSYVAAKSGKEGAALNDLLCDKLHLSTLRFGKSDAWPDLTPFANHSKFFMVDDNVAYVGSANLYPSDLQEYGVFLSDPQAIAGLKSQYWDQLWNYSSRVAISGREAASCYFKQ